PWSWCHRPRAPLVHGMPRGEATDHGDGDIVDAGHAAQRPDGARRAPAAYGVTMDLKSGIAIEDIADGGMLAGEVGDEKVVLVRHGQEVFAVGAECTHYHGPLAEGIVAGESIRCPLHHACFDL